jgi:hypothetical protein
VLPESEINFEDTITHDNLEEVYPITKVESSPNPVKVNFFAKEAGLYKILWSNDHSWFTAKTLRYRINVLKPVEEGHEDLKEGLYDGGPNSHQGSPESHGFRKKTNLGKLISIPLPVIESKLSSSDTI